MERFKFTRLPLLVTLLITSASLSAASISGIVRDTAKRPLANVSLTFNCVKNKQSTSQSTKTNKYGLYMVKSLPDVAWCSVKVNFDNKAGVRDKINSGSGRKNINITLNSSGNQWQVIL